MSVSLDECDAIIQQFKRAHQPFLRRAEVHGIQVTYRNGAPTIIVLVTALSDPASRLSDEQIPHQFAYDFDNINKMALVEIEVAPIARAQTGILCHPGDPASGNPQSFYGTLGWNFYLNGTLVCLSNWHVFCALQNETPTGSTITINGSPEARLYAFQKVQPTGNVWDYALAEYLQPTDAAGAMRACDDGTSFPYPGRLSAPESVRLGDGSAYYKVGARGPTCRTGTLVAAGDRGVLYEDGVTRWFTNQFIFSKMTDPGDSGAVIVRQSDTSVTGLNFAGDATSTIANPICRAGWTRMGSVRLDGGDDIPMMSGSAVLSHNLPLITPDLSASPSASELRIPTPVTNHAFRALDLPNLQAGRLFLGQAVAVINPANGSIARWIQPPPPPIRSDVPVVNVQIRVGNGTPGGRNEATYLCFG